MYGIMYSNISCVFKAFFTVHSEFFYQKKESKRRFLVRKINILNILDSYIYCHLSILFLQYFIRFLCDSLQFTRLTFLYRSFISFISLSLTDSPSSYLYGIFLSLSFLLFLFSYISSYFSFVLNSNDKFQIIFLIFALYLLLLLWL